MGCKQAKKILSLLHAPFVLGLVSGGAIIYWFTGASIQAVTTGAYRAVEFIKQNIKLDGVTKASVEDSKRVVAICTRFVQRGMFNIFLAVVFITLGFALLSPLFRRIPLLNRNFRTLPSDLYGERWWCLGQREEYR